MCYTFVKLLLLQKSSMDKFYTPNIFYQPKQIMLNGSLGTRIKKRGGKIIYINMGYGIVVGLLYF